MCHNKLQPSQVAKEWRNIPFTYCLFSLTTFKDIPPIVLPSWCPVSGPQTIGAAWRGHFSPSIKRELNFGALVKLQFGSADFVLGPSEARKIVEIF